jgi:glycosyltransferase involved in cell wall biosynthesis
MIPVAPSESPNPRRIRVVMLVRRLRHAGGAEAVVAGLAEHLPRDRFEVTVCTTRPGGGRLSEAIEAAGLRHLSLDRHRSWQLDRFGPLAALLRRERVDVLHSHMFSSNVWGTLLGRLCGVPAVIAHEHGASYQDWRRRLVTRQLIGRLADRIVAVSTAEREHLVSDVGIPPDKVVVIPNGYVPRSPRAGDLRAELGLGPDSLVLGTIAQLRPEKALDVLIDSFALLRSKVPAAVLVIAGSGRGLKDRLIAHAASSGVRDSVRFLGYRDDIDVVLGGIDIAAISSDREGSPLFACECMGHRVPLVATDVGGVREVAGDSALLVPPRDPAALAEALHELAVSPSRRAELAERGSERLEHFSIGRMTGDVGALYEQVLGERRR